MGYDLSFALHRDEPLTADERAVIVENLRKWRGKIIGYDWRVRDVPGKDDMIAWGALRPTRGNPNFSDDGGYLIDVVEHLFEALADLRDEIRGVRLVFADSFGALAWKNISFTYDKQAPYPDLPSPDDESWRSLAAEHALPEGKAAVKANKPGRPKTKAEALAALDGADRDQLIRIVSAPLNKQVRDVDRSAAVELLGRDDDPRAAEALVARVRGDGFARKWTEAALTALARTPRRCSWATALLAFDRKLPGASRLLWATVTDDAVPHLLRLRVDAAWSSLALRALETLDSEGAREARMQLLGRTRALDDAQMVDAIVAATPVQAAALLDGKEPKPPIGSLTQFSFRHARTGDLHLDHRPELWQLEAYWLQSAV